MSRNKPLKILERFVSLVYASVSSTNMLTKRPLHWIILSVILLGGQCAYASTEDSLTAVYVIEGQAADYHQLQKEVYILTESAGGYTIDEVTQLALQPLFEPASSPALDLQTYQYYWGRFQIKNQVEAAFAHTEWVLSFSSNWTYLDIFLQRADGSWERHPNGTFTPERLKQFAPTARGNLIKITLPPNEVQTVYFRGASNRMAMPPNCYIRLKHMEDFYNDLLVKKASDALFIGFLLMMFIYNLILYFVSHDRSFLFYSGYLILVVVYSGYLSEDWVEWLAAKVHLEDPRHFYPLKLSIYGAMMCYLAFIRSFLDLERLLPKWDVFYRYVIYLGFPLMALNLAVLYWSDFSYVLENRVVVSYTIVVIVACCSLLYPLYRTKDKKGYFIIAGIAVICLGTLLTVVSLVWLPPFSPGYLKVGTVIEVIIFSLGLAYRRQQQERAQREAELLEAQQRTEAKRLKELDTFKARFYTNITHEFRTPLTVIMGMNDQIKGHDKEKKLIGRNSENLLELVNQLLALSKLEAGALPLNQTQGDIVAYLQYLTESFYSTATQRNIRLVFDADEPSLKMDYDEEKIKQIVHNLLSNALKFTPEYGRIIFRATRVNLDEKPLLKLSVKDTGIGIPQQHIEQIFERFYQAELPDDYHAPQGTGVGLALTRELVELMQGSIEVKSEASKGTEFILHLPIKTEATPTPQTSPDPSQPTPSQLLLIEDNPDIVTYIQALLQNTHDVHIARDGAAGIEKALEIIPDIIISDVMMPKKTGYEVCETLKQDERTSHIPIILLTAKTSQSDKLTGLQHGADAYLTKPFNKEELMVRLEKLVALRKQLQSRYTNSAAGHPADASAIPSPEDTFLEKLHTHIQAHLSDAQFGVPQLAKASHLSQMQLYRKLKALTGRTPSQFIRAYRLRQSLDLLRAGQLNVSEVAYEVGFTDPSYFSRVFQKEFKRNPSSLIGEN